MSARRLKLPEHWRRRRVYQARVVNSEEAPVLVKSAQHLKVGKRISFARIADLEAGTAFDWRSAVIWRIEKGCLHLTRT